MTASSKKRANKVHWLDLGVYEWDLAFNSGGNHHRVHKEVFGCDTDFEPTPGIQGVTFTQRDSRRSLVWVPPRAHKRTLANILAHEAVHVSMAIVRGTGLVVSEDSEEAIAYLVGHISGFLNKSHASYRQRPKK